MKITTLASYPVPIADAWDTHDSSKFQDYLGCPRYYFLRHVLGLDSPMPNLDLVFGSAWHAAMEHLLQKGYDPETISEAYETRFLPIYREVFSEEWDSLNSPKNPLRAREALLAYTGRYLDDLERYEVLYTEVTGEVEVLSNLSLVYKLDALLRNRETEKILALEHKTSKNLNDLWLLQWFLSIQLGTYDHALLWKMGAENTEGLIVNGAFFKRVKDDSKAEKHQFERVAVVRTNEQRLVWFSTVRSIFERLLRDFEGLASAKESDSVLSCFPLNPKNCSSYARKCQYHDFCLFYPNPIQRLGVLTNDFVVRFWNPLEAD